MKFTSEMLENAKSIESVEELITLAKEKDVDVTEEQIRKFYATNHKSGELSDDELNNVAGGWCYQKGSGKPVITIGEQHECFECKHVVPPYGFCGATRADSYMTALGWKHKCNHDEERFSNCQECRYCEKEDGLWLCGNPANNWSA